MSIQIFNLIIWYLLIVFIGIMATPVTFRLFRSLPDRGYSVTKPFGILLVSYIFWLLTALGVLKNNYAGACIAIVVFIILAIWLTKKSGISDIKNWFIENKKFVIFSELIFFVVFVLMAVIRAYNPDIWGTEKPMELMFINSINRSPTFPPQDAWLSGYSISYYYFGYVIVALIARLTGTPAGIAFNLGIALVFAMAFIAAFGIVLNMIVTSRRFLKNNINGLVSAILPALLGPMLVLTMGNFYGVLEVMNRNNILADVNIPVLHYAYGNPDPVNGISDTGGIQSENVNFWQWMDIKQLNKPEGLSEKSKGFKLSNWFFASRTIQDRNLSGASTEVIDEFPAFSFLLADFHPHVLALPFVLLAILVAYEWLLSGSILDNATLQQKYHNLEKIILSALVFGSLIFLNTWDFPIYAFVFSMIVLLKVLPDIDKGNWRWVIGKLFKLIFSIFGLSVILFLPFILTLQSQAGGILPNIVFPTKFRQIFILFGPILLPLITFMAAYFIKHRKDFAAKRAIQISGLFFILLVLSYFVLILLKLKNPGSGNLILSMMAPYNWRDGINMALQRRFLESATVVVGLILIIFSTGFLFTLKKNIGTTQKFIFVLILTGSLLLIGPEFVYLQDQFGTRMNTVFKFYFQIWILWSLAAAYVSWFIYSKLKIIGRWVYFFMLTIVFLSGMVYSVGTIIETTQGFTRKPTLDGLNYYVNYYPEDWAAVQWLNKNVSKNDVVLEGTRGAYWIEGRSSRIAMLTGIPTVMGWVNHESQWRGSVFSEVANREGDINTIYVSRDWETTKVLLDKYNINYVVISPSESQWYGTINLSKFENNMTLVFENGETFIYYR
jgi:YYY domain-containing protein